MRISRHQMFMEMCETLAKRSTCYRGNNGAMIVQDNDVLSVGYNGSPPGEEHCKGNDCPLNAQTGGCLKSKHAEDNAIMRALVKTKKAWLPGCILYTTSCPCRSCAERIKKAEVRCVIFRYPYRNTDGLEELKAEKHISIYRLTASGYLINERTGLLENA